MVSFRNFARIVSLCVGFLLDTLHGYFLHSDFWPNLNFLLKHQIKLVLMPEKIGLTLPLALLPLEIKDLKLKQVRTK